MIFIPYFISIKRLSSGEALNKINDWLDRCNSKFKLNFPKRKVNYQINKAGTYFPPKQENLEQINKSFYEELKAEVAN